MCLEKGAGLKKKRGLNSEVGLSAFLVRAMVEVPVSFVLVARGLVKP